MAFNQYLHNLHDFHVIGKIFKLQCEQKNPASHVSHVTCHMLRVMCHLSPVISTNSHSHRLSLLQYAQ